MGLKRSKLPSFICIIIATIVVFIFAMSGCGNILNSGKRNAEDDKIKTVSVEVENVLSGDLEITKEYTGKLKPIKDIMIIPKMPGKVSKIYVKIGQKVKKGDILIEFDSSDIDLQIAQAKAAYNVARLNVEASKEKINNLKSSKGEMDSGISKINSGITQIDKALSEINKQSAGLEEMFKSGKLDKDGYAKSRGEIDAKLKQLDEERTALINNKQQAEKAKKDLDNAILQMPSSKLLDAQLKQAKIGVDIANNTSKGLKLCSPIDGIVGSMTVEEGQMAVQTSPPLTIMDTTTLLLDANVTENEINNIDEGQNIKVYVDALAKEPFDGEVNTISPAIDPRTQSFPVSIKIPNNNNKLKPGMFARAILLMDKRQGTVTAPKNCLIREDNKYFVFIVEDGKAKKQEVKIGIDNDERVEVLSGVQVNDQVVTRGQEYLKDGINVTVVRGESK